MPKIAQFQTVPVRSYEAEKRALKDASEFPLRRKVFWECLSPISAKFLIPCKASLCQSVAMGWKALLAVLVYYNYFTAGDIDT